MWRWSIWNVVALTLWQVGGRREHYGSLTAFLHRLQSWSCWGLVGTSTRESGGLRCSRPSLPGGQHSVCLHFRWKNLDSYMTPAMQSLMISLAWWMYSSYFTNCSLKHLLQNCRKFRKRQWIHKVAPSLYLSFIKLGLGRLHLPFVLFAP